MASAALWSLLLRERAWSPKQEDMKYWDVQQDEIVRGSKGEVIDTRKEKMV